jgi:5'-3' exonuclease
VTAPDAPPVVLAVDGNSLVHRSFHALASSDRPSWAVRGLLTQLVAAVDRIRPAAVVVGFDDPERSLRRETWPEYKAHRGEKLDSLVEQLDEAVTAMRDLGVAVCVPRGLEADDVLASTAAAARVVGARTVVCTSDRDAFSLICDDTAVLRIINGGVEASPLMTADRLVLLLGVRAEQYRDFAALRGDPSDNLPGVRGIGPRLAARLLTEFRTAAAAFADLDAVAVRVGKGVARLLAQPGAEAAWRRNCEVMTMRSDVSVGLCLDQGPGVMPLAVGAVESVFRRLGMTWTAAPVRVLAEVEADPVEPVVWPAVTVAEDVRHWTNSPRRLPRLRRAAEPSSARGEQLSLFD